MKERRMDREPARGRQAPESKKRKEYVDPFAGNRVIQMQTTGCFCSS
ncbi:MAG: hypothetical protein QM296_04895 [Bacillota bacterium]|nr:hypothetical protein [Bacillota bacterium]